MSKYRKAVAAILAFAGVVASSGLMTGTAELVLNTLIAAVGAALVIILPNEPSTSARAREAYGRPGA